VWVQRLSYAPCEPTFSVAAAWGKMSPWIGEQPWQRSIQVQPKPESNSFNPIRHALPKCPGYHICVRRVHTSIRFHFAPHLSSYLFKLNLNSFPFNRLLILHGHVPGHSFPRPKPTSKTASITMRRPPTHRARRHREHCGANHRRRVCRSRQPPPLLPAPPPLPHAPLDPAAKPCRAGPSPFPLPQVSGTAQLPPGAIRLIQALPGPAAVTAYDLPLQLGAG